MRFEFKPSFDRSIKTLQPEVKEELKKVASQTIDILSRDGMMHKGIGLKRLRGDFWEVRRDLKARILFRWQGDLVEFILASNHADIKRYLRNI